MKKALKIIGAIVLACALFAGGYFAGQNVQISSVLSAMPKRSADNTPPEGEKIKENITPDATVKPPEEPIKETKQQETPTDRTISVSSESAVDDTWSKVAGTTSASGGESLMLYTSAIKDGDEFIWDDSNKWVLELSTDSGYYTLYDQQISNGYVYYEVAEKENVGKVIYLYAVTGSGVNVMQYTQTDAGFTEKSVYNSGSLNRTFSSIPQY